MAATSIYKKPVPQDHAAKHWYAQGFGNWKLGPNWNSAPGNDTIDEIANECLRRGLHQKIKSATRTAEHEVLLKVKVGSESLELPIELQAIANEIAYSNGILDLEEGWNGDDAVKIQEPIVIVAAKFLKMYAYHILKATGGAIHAPEINPCPSGSIDLSWRTPRVRLLITIENEDGQYNALYYGDFYDFKEPIEGKIPVSEIKPYFAEWMKNLV